MVSLMYLPFLSEYHKSIELSKLTSSSDKVKLKTSKFSSILFGVTDFGMTITPRWTYEWIEMEKDVATFCFV